MVGWEVAGFQREDKCAGAQPSTFHATTSAQAARGVASGIDPKYFNPNSRFGPGFYVAQNGEVALAEMAHHGIAATHGVRFEINMAKAQILDLTNPMVAKSMNYSAGPISSTTQAIGAEARRLGYNVIKFPSTQAVGSNFAVLDDFNDILTPQMITPTTP